MPRMGPAFIAFAVVFGMSVSSLSAAPGCPFCPPTQPTYSEQLSQSDVACQVKWVGVTEKADEDGAVGSATTTFEVVEVITADDKKLALKTKITVDFLRTGKPGDLFLLMGKRSDGEIAWGAPIEVSEDSYQYIRQAPPFDAPAEKRLKFFLKFLEMRDPQIANDAFAEFSRARYEDVAGLSGQLPREKIRTWLETPETTKIRLGFYGLLLGLCGNDDDAAFLETQIFSPVAEDDVRLGIDGMMGGYLLLRGAPGLEKLVDGKLKVPDTARTDLFAVLNALRFAGEYARDRLPTAQLQSALRSFLDREEFAEIVVADLARWKDWSVLDRLLANFGQPPFETESGKLKVIQFAQACAKDTRTDKEIPLSVAEAKRFLAQVEKESPDLIRQTRRPTPIQK